MRSCLLRGAPPCYLFCLWALLALLAPPVSPQHASHHRRKDHGGGGGGEGDGDGVAAGDRPKLLLVSFDGFRWDYVDRVPTPNFHDLQREGVKVEVVENAYITKTFPNHYSLVTGLYTETHGIVANEMFDPVFNRSFSMETDSIYDPRWWEQAVPLWVTNQRAGGRSGAAMWPGSDVKIHGVYPTRYLPYNASVPFGVRVHQLIEWFTAPDQEAVDFGVLYWEEPDESGHNLGPESSLMDGVIVDIDEKLGFLRNELKKAGLYERLNLVVTSDHGMTQLSPDKIIELDLYVSRDLYTWVDKSPVVGLLPKEVGNHGYNNTLPSMHPVFLAQGPAFRQDYVKKTMRSVDLYPLMCHILGVPPLPNNGSLANVRDLLVSVEPSAPPPAAAVTPADPGMPDSGSGGDPARGVTPGYAYAPATMGTLLGMIMVLGFLLVFIRQVTLKQLPSLPMRSREMSQPLLQNDLHL
ncbi:hypothetical protein CRUP_017803 [Coryphaenoides rupestris]|nr:hypothetical protein CRUP_017803 [Coryphaenoides rupestris]